MVSDSRIGIAPLVIGVVLAGQSLSQLVQGSISIWMIGIFVGSCAAIFVGVRTLTASTSDTAVTGSERPLALVGIAVFSFVAGSIAFTL